MGIMRPVVSCIIAVSSCMQKINGFHFVAVEVLHQLLTTPYRPQFQIQNKAFRQKPCRKFFRQLPGIVPILLNSIPIAPGNGIRGYDGTINA